MKFKLPKQLMVAAGVIGALALVATPVVASTFGQSAQDTAAQSDTKAIAALATPDCSFFSATNSATQNRVYTNNTAGFYVNSAAWADLACGTFNVTVPRGRSALAVVKVDGEVTCTAAVATDSQWCQGRVLLNGVEGKPNAPEPDSFAWANSQVDPNAWESNAFTRTGYLRCPSTVTTTVCTFPVKVQVKNHAAGLNFRVDDATVDARLTYF